MSDVSWSGSEDGSEDGSENGIGEDSREGSAVTLDVHKAENTDLDAIANQINSNLLSAPPPQ